jgi:alkanesulfonate monooxygenase SsuD/methylene tetrahydromethanopterin reductase-like flavin-dependent oxidoreductase (luciferase family)/hemerythrin-like domain-containing protein
MSDYGHPLSFGAFLTPTNDDAAQLVALAVLAEEIGLDLVTFQDHPYQPGFFDTWTLLSFVAARTERVHLAPNVANLPLRPPAVLARSVASLDLLSGGRVELGLGAGAFWDAIEAMGGRRLSPGEGVRALEEAIDVLRQIWDGDARGGVRVDGEYYRVKGAKRGPSPAHPVGIWLGAYKPKMLALTGRRADGWLPSLSYLQPGDLAAGNALIDDAAHESGRNPEEIRRLLNINGHFTSSRGGPLEGPVSQWVEELAELALNDGVSTFIIGSNDPDDLRRFAEDVAPALGELVTAERASSGSSISEPPSPPASSANRAFVVIATRDDGVRRSSRRLWDESTRPSGPEPDLGTAYSELGVAAAQDLVDVHNMLRAELTQIHDLIEQVAAGTIRASAARSEINAMTIRQNNWTLGSFCESYCRIVTLHHSLEDQQMFPHLRDGDPRLAPVIDRLEEEHHTIHDVLEDVDRALVSLVAGSDDVAALRASFDLLSDTLLSHLAYEERTLLEPIGRLGLW